MIDLERHRSLLVAALHSHAEQLDHELDVSLDALNSLGTRAAIRQRIVRERADSLDLARELECS